MKNYIIRYATDHVSQDWVYLADHNTTVEYARVIANQLEISGRHVEILEDTYVVIRTAIVYNSISGRL